jgi:hypothetical protein
MRTPVFAAFVLLASCLTPRLALAASGEADVQARYCLDVLHLQDRLAAQARPPAQVDRVLGASGEQRGQARRRLESYLASRRLEPAEAEAVKRARTGDLAADVTDLIFAAPRPDCPREAVGVCRLETWMQDAARRERHARCVADLSWLPTAGRPE